MDAGYAAYDLKGNKVQDVIGSGGSATTALIFSGVEDLGGGVKGLFQYEIDPNIAQTSNRTAGTSATGTASNVTTSAGNGQSFVGVDSPFGTVKFGAPNSATLAASGDGNGGFATAIGSGYRVTSFDAVRFQSSLRYDTPNFSGFAASLLFSPKNNVQANAGNTGLSGNLQNQTNGRDQAQEIGLSYANGPLTVRYANLRIGQYAKVNQSAAGDVFVANTWSAVGTGQAFKLDTLSVKYANALPGLTLNGFYQSIKSDTLNNASATALTAVYDRKTTGVSASYAITPVLTGTVNYAVAKNGAAASNTGTANRDTTVTGLGLDYALSKRTALYARYERDADLAGLRSITGYTAVGGSTTYTATAVGVRHTF